MKIPEKYNRRKLLRGLGLGVGLLPVLESEWARAGCVPTPPVRLMTWVYTNGATNTKYWPTTEGAGYTLNEATALIAPVKDKVTFVQGMRFQSAIDSPNNVSGHHDLPSVLTGVPMVEHVHNRAIAIAGGPSIDQYVVDAIRKSNPNEPRPIVIAYHPSREPQISWRGARMPESAQTDLNKVFSTLFMNGAAPVLSTAELTKLRAARKSMLDLVGRDIERFCKNLGSDDRMRCQGHLNSFREVETLFNMKEVKPADPTMCKPPTLQAGFSSTNNADMPKYMDALIKMVTAGFASGASRSIAFQFGDGVGDALTYPHIGVSRNSAISIYEKGSGVDHGESHTDSPNHFKARHWLFGQFAALVKALDEVKEDGRSLLDNSIVYMVSNMATGGSHDVGRGRALPAMYAGSGGGYLKTGVHLKFPLTPQNRLFYEFMNAMKLDPKGYDNGRYGTELPQVRA